jgi:aspartyl-tRNA(Asn)/glutamyl-tRNA(Gln) amidotransferase subunit A
LAAGIAPLHVGTDGGGSIRIPSGFAGVFGIKATFGRVPVYPSSPFGTLSHVGPMARNVCDAALMLSVISEPDGRDPLSLPFDGRDYLEGLDGGVKGLRIAYSETLGFATTDPEVAERVSAAVRLFEELGAHVEVADPDMGDPTPVFRAHWHAGACGVVRGLTTDQRAELDPGLIALLQSRPELSLGEYQDAITARAALAIEMARFHQEYDLLLTPTLPLTAFEAGRLGAPERSPDDWIGWTPFSYPFNLTQQPACSVPCGLAPDGLPVGLQIVGRRFDEALVLRAAYAIEQALAPGPDWPEL